MTGAPKYPRIGLLDSAGASADDLVLEPRLRGAWFGTPVVVEEKLDGANVSIWIDDDQHVACASRGGVGAMDRAGQMGRLRAWAAEHTSALSALLCDGSVLYGEWLYLEHSVRYDALPDWLVALDLWHPGYGFMAVEERDRRCAVAGVVCAPVLYRGVLRGDADLVRLAGTSRFGHMPMEGLILRKERDGHLEDRVKWLRPGFARVREAHWRGGRPTNTLGGRGAEPR